MPLTRYQLRNEYSLADPELYRAADKNDPEALLEGVAMAGLVGVLRQLGDLAEFAAEIFHDLHEEVMATAARGHGLMARVQQLEIDFPSIEKAFLSQSNHSSFYYNPGVDWRHNVRMDQNLITQGDLPRFIMDSYEECRGPPQLFLLDKFDVAGAGACLKRYTDPSFFKEESMSSNMPNPEIHRDKKSRRVKKRGSHWKNGETPDALPTSHVKLHQLLLEERVESGKSDPARLVKLKRRQLSAHYDSQSGKSYMASFLQTLSPEQKEVHEISISPSPLSDSGLAILDVQTVGNAEDSYEAERSKCSSLTEAIIGRIKDSGSDSQGETSEIIPNLQIVGIEKDQSVDEESTEENSFHVPPDDSLDVASETENYVDALATMESETETDSEYRARSDSHCCNKVKQSSFLANGSHLFDSQSVCNSSSLDSRPNLVRKEVSSHCEIQSHLAEERRSDLDGALVVPNSMGGFESEMVATTFGLHSASEEVSQIKSDESLVLGTSYVKVDEIPSPAYETRELSCGSCRTDSHSTIWPSDPKSGAEKILLSEPHFGERSSDSVKLSKESLDTEVIVTHAGIVIAPNLAQKVTQPGTVTAFEFDSGEPSVESDALLHLSDGLDLACQQGCNEIVIPYVLYEGHAIDISPGNLDDGDIGSPLSFVLSPEEQILNIELPEVEPSPCIVPSSDAEKCDMVSEVGDEDRTTGINENTIPSVDFPGIGNFLDQIQPEKTYIIAPRSATVDVLSSTEIKDLKEASNRYDEMQGNGYDLSTVVCDATSLGILSEYPGEDRSSDGKMPPSIQMEDVCLEESVLFPSRNADCEQIEVIEKTFSVRNLGAISCGNGSYEHFDIKLLNDVPDPLRDPYIDILSTWGGILSPSLDKNEQNIDSPINVPSFALAEPSETSQQQDDQDIKECPNDFPSLPGKQTYPYSINDATSSSTFCEKDVLFPDEIPFIGPSQDEQTQGCLHLDGGPLLALQGQLSFKSDDRIPSRNKYLSEVETFPKLGLELLCDQTDMKDLSSKEEAGPTTSDVKSEDRSSLCQSDTQYYFYHSGGTCPEDLRTQEYAPKILQQPENEKLKHKESSKAISASSEVLPLISKDTAEEIPSVSSSTIGREVEVGFSGSQVDCLLPENPFMPLTSHNAPEKISPEDMRFSIPLITLLNGSEPRPPPEPPSVGESLLPNPTPSSLVWEVEGILVEDALIQVDQNLLHPLHHLTPETCSGIEAEDNFQDLEGEMLNQPEVIKRLQSGESELPQHGLLADTATYIGELSNPSAPESFSNDEKAEYTFQDIQGERGNDAKMTNNWQSMIEEPPHQGWRTSEGEIAWSLSLPFSGDLNKLSRPRNPLIDAVAAHDKSKLRKVAERIRPQMSPVINERGSLLEQIRTKSFNLKPAAVTRPSFQGPKTNLKIAAILEKANAIRQATAGSDEDSWSDS